MTNFHGNQHIVVMGVSGCGKSTVGETLARRLNFRFTDGDTLHPPANIAKMEAGVPLQDDDRWPWLDCIGDELAKYPKLVIACSALRRTYRDRIRKRAERPVTFVHLTGSRAVLEKRIDDREGHFMPPALLDSQLSTLEVPQENETVVTVDIDATIEEIVDRAVAGLGRLEVRK